MQVASMYGYMYMYTYSHPGVDRTGSLNELQYVLYIAHILSTSGWRYICVYMYSYIWMSPSLSLFLSICVPVFAAAALSKSTWGLPLNGCNTGPCAVEARKLEYALLQVQPKPSQIHIPTFRSLLHFGSEYSSGPCIRDPHFGNGKANS